MLKPNQSLSYYIPHENTVATTNLKLLWNKDRHRCIVYSITKLWRQKWAIWQQQIVDATTTVVVQPIQTTDVEVGFGFSCFCAAAVVIMAAVVSWVTATMAIVANGSSGSSCCPASAATEMATFSVTASAAAANSHQNRLIWACFLILENQEYLCSFLFCS